MSLKIKTNGRATAFFHKKGGFPSFIEVKDSKGRIIHQRKTNSALKRLKINFPFSDIFEMNFEADSFEILPLQTIKLNGFLPQPERHREKKVKTIYNPKLEGTPARIYSELGVIEYGDKLLKLPKYAQVFVMLHEYGHFFYKTEWKTDLFALYWFIKLGYNPSAAFLTLANVLSDNPQSNHRIKNLFTAIFKHYKPI